MSHDPSCPDPWEARRQGRWAALTGRNRWANPFVPDGEQPCEEAEEEWRRAYDRGRRERAELLERESEER